MKINDILLKMTGIVFMWSLIFVVSTAANGQSFDQLPSWQAYDESEELAEQADHQTSRLRFKLINSKVLNKNNLWTALEADMGGFNAQRYEELKSLILERSIPQIQGSVAQGELSYEELTKFYLYRIRLIESDNSRALNAIISTLPDAISQARLKDEARLSGDIEISDNSIFGMPVLLKDNIGVQGAPTTAGAVALQNNRTSDAFITSQLKASGAIILGKANLSEWAYYFCDGCPLGYSALGGQTMNPYGRKQIESGGSSSGSAVAVAANLAVAAVGSETSGSILSPASLNSVVGLKPTTGMLSRSGVVPISSTLDTTGPIAKTMVDAVILFNAMAGYDEADTAMPLLSADASLIPTTADLAVKRLGYFANFETDELYKKTLDSLRDAGATLIAVALPDLALQNFSEFMGAEMAGDLKSYLSEYANGPEAAPEITSVDDVVEFNLREPQIRMPYGQGRFDAILAINDSPEQIAQLRTQIRETGSQALSTPIVSNNLDAILSINNYHASWAAAANFPALTIPMGFRDNGAPAGITLISPSFSEQDLIEIGLGVERVLGARRMPADYQ